MKKFWVILAVSLSFFLFLCTSNSQSLIVRSYVEPGTLNEEQIIAEVERSLSTLVNGIVERDAHAIFSIFSDPARARYIRDGAIYKSISSAEKTYAKWFEGQDHSIKRVFEFQRKEFDIISPTTVLFTGIGVSRLDEQNLPEQSREIAYTILWMRESDEWKAVNMHISWE